MQINQKKNIFQMVLSALVVVSAFSSWLSVDRAVRVSESSTWLVPMLNFSLFAVLLYLTVITFKEKRFVALVSFLSFSLSLIFVFNLRHVLVFLIAFLLVTWGLSRTRTDLDLNVKISLWKSLLTGKTQLIFAVALLVSSQYFFTIGSMDGQKVMPEFDLSGASSKIMVPIFGFINPSFKAMNDQNITVDQFILKAQEENFSSSLSAAEEELVDSKIPAELPAQQRDAIKAEALEKMGKAKANISKQNQELILQEGRNQFSKMIGREVKGDEKMADIFSGLVNKKINEYFQPKVQGDSNSALFPLILSLVLFLTVAPLGSVLSRLWFLLIILLFKLLVRFGLVEIRKETVERECIQY